MTALLADPGPRWQRRYWAIFAGQALSLTGSALTQFVLMWWIADSTGQVSALALAGVFALLPQAVLAPLAGTFADRYSRRAIMILTDLVSAAAILLLILLFHLGGVALWQIWAIMAVRSAMQAFQHPAAAASTARLVPASFLTRAAGLNQLLYGLMTVGAPMLGALAIGAMPVGQALWIDVGTAVAGVVPLVFFAVPQDRPDRASRPGLWPEFRDGLHLVWGDVALRHLYLLMAAVMLVIVPPFHLVALLVRDHFHGGPPQLALMESTGGIGLALGGLGVAALAPRRPARWAIWGLALCAYAVALTAAAPAGALWLGVAGWTLSYATWAAGNGPLMAIVQTRVPNAVQGRALALLSMIVALAAPLGLAAAVPLGDLLGIRGLFILTGLVGGTVALLGLASRPLRALDRP